MRHIETLKGDGVVTFNASHYHVHYVIDVFEHVIATGLGGTIPGLRQISGRIHPVSGPIGKLLTLTLADARTLTFYFKDSRGTVVVSGPIQSPSMTTVDATIKER
jgi:hypothetical protein